MRTIRNTRLKKYGKRTWNLILGLKIAVIWYVLICTTIYISSDTGAAFNDLEVISNHIQTQWDVPQKDAWDKSSLRFTGKAGIDSNGSFFQNIINGGDRNMQGSSIFVVYFTESGSAPNKNNKGVEVFRGVIPALKSGQSTRLVYLPKVKPKQGKYKFMAYQRPGHPGEGELWGDEIQF